MIVSKDTFHKDKLSLKRIQTYTNGFTFYPLLYQGNQCLFQTPPLFVPYGIQTSDSKQMVTLSFVNRIHDKYVEKLHHSLDQIFLFLQTQLTTVQLAPLVKSNELRVRLYHCLLFDESKQKLDTIPPNIYGQFILNVYGVWCYDNIGYVQCYAIQAKLYQPMYLTTYGFLDETKSKIPVPPPLPTSLKKQYQRKLKPKPKPKPMNGFQPPSLDEIQSMLQKFQSQ